VPDALINARRVNAHQHLAVAGDWCGGVSDPKNVD
jgi:hypothetical protein